MIFSAEEYAFLSKKVFTSTYPGYKQDVIESPNGDGKFDTEKKYAHIAMKYLNEYALMEIKETQVLKNYLWQAHQEALRIAIELGVPKELWPSVEYSTIRILEYPPGAESNLHTDFDLFTLSLYRNMPDKLDLKLPNLRDWVKIPEFTNYSVEDGYQKWTTVPSSEIHHSIMEFYKVAETLSPKIHFGELFEIINPLALATPHKVRSDNYRTQYSIVYFAIPDHAVRLPNGKTVGEWIEERIVRSRKNINYE